jgi:hypothetical protein
LIFIIIVRDLAMGFVHHVPPHRFQAGELLSSVGAIQAEVADGDLLSQIREESADIDKMILIWDEEAVLPRHVREDVRDAGRLAGAEKAIGVVTPAA